MIARLIRVQGGNLQLLCPNGTIDEGTEHVLANLLLNFQSANRFSGNKGRWDDRVLDIGLFPGTTIAYVTDDFELVIRDQEPFASLIQDNYRHTKFLTVEQYAQKHNKSREIIKVYCREGKIVGAGKKGGCWIIPEDAPYPVPLERRREGYRGPRKRKLN